MALEDGKKKKELAVDRICAKHYGDFLKSGQLSYDSHFLLSWFFFSLENVFYVFNSLRLHKMMYHIIMI